HFKIFEDVVGVHSALVNTNKTNAALPHTIVGNFIAEHKGVGVVPVRQHCARFRVDVTGELTIHINAPPVNGIEGGNHMLQSRLQTLVVGVGRQFIQAVGVTAVGAV